MFSFCSNSYVVGIMVDMHSRSVLICGIIPHKRMFILASGYLGGVRFGPNSLIYFLVLQDISSWYMCRDVSVQPLSLLRDSRLLVVKCG
jgi:hypothetical protein